MPVAVGLAALHPGLVYYANEVKPYALDVLVAKYPPYADARPAGPLLVITPTAWAGWTARS